MMCPSFGSDKNYQVEHYFPANFLFRVMKRQLSTALGLVSWRFRPCSLPPYVLNAGRYLEMLHTTKTSNMLFYFNPIMKSCHSNKNPYFSNGHVTDDVITLDVTWEDILWQILSCCGLTFYV